MRNRSDKESSCISADFFTRQKHQTFQNAALKIMKRNKKFVLFCFF